MNFFWSLENITFVTFLLLLKGSFFALLLASHASLTLSLSLILRHLSVAKSWLLLLLLSTVIKLLALVSLFAFARLITRLARLSFLLWLALALNSRSLWDVIEVNESLSILSDASVIEFDEVSLAIGNVPSHDCEDLVGFTALNHGFQSWSADHLCIFRLLDILGGGRNLLDLGDEVVNESLLVISETSSDVFPVGVDVDV